MAERKVVNSHDFMCEGYDSNGNKVVPRGESSYLMARTIVLVYENGTTNPNWTQEWSILHASMK